MKATWSKNKTSGKWGFRVELNEPFEELPEPGDEVTVTKKDGKTQTQTLGAKVWSGENDGFEVALYALPD